MYRTGHLGVSLAVCAPLGAALAAAGRIDLAYLAGVTMLWLAMLPDVDHRIPGLSHRGVTHTLLFALLVGGAFGLAGAAAARVAPVDPGVLVPFGVAIGVATVLAHLLADLLTPSGVPLLWPITSRRYSFDLVRASNRIANYLLLVLGLFAAATMFVFAVRYGAA